MNPKRHDVEEIIKPPKPERVFVPFVLRPSVPEPEPVPEWEPTIEKIGEETKSLNSSVNVLE